MIYICHLWCWQPLTLHLLCVACFIVWIFFPFSFSIHSQRLTLTIVRVYVSVCSCCKDEHSVPFLQGNCRNYNRFAFPKSEKNCDCVVYLLSIWLNCLIWYMECALFDNWCCCCWLSLILLVFVIAGIIRFYLKCLASCSLFPSWLRTFIWKSAVLFSLYWCATHSSWICVSSVCLYIALFLPVIRSVCSAFSAKLHVFMLALFISHSPFCLLPLFFVFVN